MSTWNENEPSDKAFAKTLGMHIRETKKGVREPMDKEHTFITGEHRGGLCKVSYVGAKNTFPTTNMLGAFAYATDEKALYINNNGWVNTTPVMSSGFAPLIEFGNTVRNTLVTGGQRIIYTSGTNAWVLMYSKTFNFNSFNRLYCNLTATIQHQTPQTNQQGMLNFEYLNITNDWVTFWEVRGAISNQTIVQSFNTAGTIVLRNPLIPLQVRCRVRNRFSRNIMYTVSEFSYLMAVI